MDHQSQLEKSKYRNWVRGGLTYKYLKEGIETFADEVVEREHSRILAHGHTCNQCSLINLKPLHKSETDPNTNKTVCPWGQAKCNCLYRNKRPCRNKVCDAILEEILKTHGSLPSTPNWKNTDLQKWCSTPWEIAKCFINAPGYAKKTTASDIDAPGLLHVFINNINLQTNLTCKITGTDVFSRVLKRRNTIFHSPTMELEDKELNELIDDVIEILEDEKELKANHDAIKAVEKLRQLKKDAFIITTHDEVEVCRAAMASIDKKYEEFKQTVEDCKNWIKSKECQVQQTADKANAEIDTKRSQTLTSISNETEQAKKKLNKQNDSLFQELKQMIDSLKERVRDLEQDNAVIKQRLTEVEKSVNLIDVARTTQQKQLDYVNQKQACQRKILDLYQNHYVKTWISPLRKQDNDININEVYVAPSMKTEEKEKESKMAAGNLSSKNYKVLNRYRDIFRTDDSLHKKIYIVGDVGSGKSSLSKIMLYNWCKAIQIEDETNTTITDDKGPQVSGEFDDINEMRRFNFVFFISLQRMSGQSSSLVEMIRLYYKDIVTSELLDRILAEESEHCLIIADGLDEWSPSTTEFLPEHVSYGLPLADKLHSATVVTLSRPSAKGILNMKSSEYDKKTMLQGIDSKFIEEFIKKYMSKQSRNEHSFQSFLHEIKMKNLKHLEKTPLLLQQLVWMYCMGHGIGKTVSEIYSNVVNIMFGWSKNKDNFRVVAEGEIRNCNEFQEMQLPMILKTFPRCEANKRYILQLGKIAFHAFSSEVSTCTFGLSKLLNSGLSQNDIATLTNFGVLVEYNCIDPTYEDVYFSFIHTSYLEFFAAVYISSQNGCTTVLEGLFQKYKRPADIVQLLNLLKLVCGLSPVLLRGISKLISINLTNDDYMIRYRQTLHKYKFSWIPTEAKQIQDLIYNCSCECETGEQPVVSLCDIVTIYEYNMSFLRKIIPSSILSLHFFPSVCDLNESQDVLKWAVQLPSLQYIYINGALSYCMSCNFVQEVASFIQKVVSLKHFSLEDIGCSDSDCTGHMIDLPKHNQIHSIYLKDCSYHVVSLEQYEHLSYIYISDCQTFTTSAKHVVLDQLVSSLKKVVSLKDLTLKRLKCSYIDCSGHIIDFPEHVKLCSIHLKDCQFEVGSLGNTEHLENVYISSKSMFVADHGMLDRLVSSMTKAVFLKELTLKRIECSSVFCGSHSIDLSAHVQFQSIHLEHCQFEVGSLGNTAYLETVKILPRYMLLVDHDRLDQLVTSLTKAVFLKHLTLRGIMTYDCSSNTINLSAHVHLQSIHLEACEFQVGSLGNTEYLEKVYISGHSDIRIDGLRQKSNLKLPNDMVGKLASSLTQAVALKHLTLQNIDCFLNTCNCKTVYIDLSHHDQLQRIEINKIPRCLSVINKCMCVEVSALLKSFYCNANIESLEIKGNYDSHSLYTIAMNSRVQSLQRLQSLSLESVQIDKNALIVSSRMENLQKINLFWVGMRYQTWRTFFDSLCTLKQSVAVEINIDDGKKVDALEYVRLKKDMFHVVNDGFAFIFKTTAK